MAHRGLVRHVLIHNSPRDRLRYQLNADDVVNDDVQPDTDGFDPPTRRRLCGPPEFDRKPLRH